MYDIVWNCKTCGATGRSKGTNMCPCPRGGCEAFEVKLPKQRFNRREVELLIDKAKTVKEIIPACDIINDFEDDKPERELWDFNDYEKTHRMQGYKPTKSPYIFDITEPVFVINGKRYSKNEEDLKYLLD